MLDHSGRTGGLMPALFTARDGQRSYRVCEIDAAPTAEHIAWMRTRDVDGLSIRLPRGTRRVFPLDWVEVLGPVRYLEIVTPWPVGSIPASAARELEVLQVQGRLHAPFDLSQAPRLRSLTLARDLLTGPLSTAPMLEHCGLDGETTFSSSVFDGCAMLRSAFVTAQRRAVEPLWDFDMRKEIPLEKLTLMDVGVRRLDGISALPRLRELIVVPREEVGLERRLDLSPLAACPELRTLVVHRSGSLDNAQVLDSLPHLERVTVAKGSVSRELEERAWLRVL
jgi:hypothetical protein